MKEFQYTVTDPLGMHARPAGLLVKEASSCESSVKIIKGKKSVDAKRIFGVMGLAVKYGERITVTVEGAQEDNEAARLEEFMRDNL
ncbi:HPr family phosphocarrier protein [Anaerocolumna xylanovorans]|uniref:Phosphocarrier protein n=1 Tax=Anaerocolumna xylanovorans DSM 12503 TaxID=1121345 RepID=A0A1M7YBK5_9FIRM|nr:HPr family phosphocarrier protein [Anaerocolumna xylanovorans]SHO50003.1 phosphocarrier protein [Anaerocolumna xylanovorans DSM 12503]